MRNWKWLSPCLAIFVLGVGVTGAQFALAADCTLNPASGKPPVANTYNCTVNQGTNALKGLHWGVGIVYAANKGGVGKVAIVKQGANNVVEVQSGNFSAARLAFELHYFFPQADSKFGMLSNEAIQWGWGPFVSLNTKPVDDLSGTNPFNSIGAGLMIGANAYTAQGAVSQSLNLGSDLP